MNEGMEVVFETGCEIGLSIGHADDGGFWVLRRTIWKKKLAKCREDIQNTEWWKEKLNLVNSAKNAEDVWPFLKKTSK
jgi:hypothetical protein